MGLPPPSGEILKHCAPLPWHVGFPLAPRSLHHNPGPQWPASANCLVFSLWIKDPLVWSCDLGWLCWGWHGSMWQGSQAVRKTVFVHTRFWVYLGTTEARGEMQRKRQGRPTLWSGHGGQGENSTHREGIHGVPRKHLSKPQAMRKWKGSRRMISFPASPPQACVSQSSIPGRAPPRTRPLRTRRDPQGSFLNGWANKKLKVGVAGWASHCWSLAEISPPNKRSQVSKEFPLQWQSKTA